MNRKDWEKALAMLRTGELRLHKVEGRDSTTYGQEHLFEIREYIAALESGYCALKREMDIFDRLRNVPLREVVDMAERNEAREPHGIEVLESDIGYKFLAGFCPKCEYQPVSSGNGFCGGCGQRLKWPALELYLPKEETEEEPKEEPADGD